MGLGVVERRGNKSKIYSIYNEIDDGQSMAVSSSTNLNQRLIRWVEFSFLILSSKFSRNFVCFLLDIMSNRRTNHSDSVSSPRPRDESGRGGFH